MTARKRLVRRSFSGGGRVLGALALTSGVVVSGCARGCTSSRPPIHLNPSMDDQPKVLTQTASTFFFNGQSMREPAPGTIPIDGLKEDTAFFTGKGADGKFVAEGTGEEGRGGHDLDLGFHADAGPHLRDRLNEFRIVDIAVVRAM